MFIDSLLVLRITVNTVYSSVHNTLSSCGITINESGRYHIPGLIIACICNVHRQINIPIMSFDLCIVSKNELK